jgi:hypothetical protein
VIELLLFGEKGTVDKDLGILVGLNEDSSFLVEERAVPRHDTQNVQLHMVFLALLGPDFGFAVFDVVEQHAQKCGII